MSAEAHIREVIRLLSLSGYGKTATGQPARIIAKDRLDQVAVELAKALGVIESRVVVDDPLPFVAWGTTNFSTWHRQAEPDLTRCGVAVPVTHARTCYRAGSAPRPVDSCEKCWAPLLELAIAVAESPA